MWSVWHNAETAILMYNITLISTYITYNLLTFSGRTLNSWSVSTERRHSILSCSVCPWAILIFWLVSMFGKRKIARWRVWYESVTLFSSGSAILKCKVSDRIITNQTESLCQEVWLKMAAQRFDFYRSHKLAFQCGHRGARKWKTVNKETF